jgi:hypothetical protein
MTGFCGSHSVSPVRASFMPDERDDVAGIGFGDFLAVVRHA